MLFTPQGLVRCSLKGGTNLSASCRRGSDASRTALGLSEGWFGVTSSRPGRAEVATDDTCVVCHWGGKVERGRGTGLCRFLHSAGSLSMIRTRVPSCVNDWGPPFVCVDARLSCEYECRASVACCDDTCPARLLARSRRPWFTSLGCAVPCWVGSSIPCSWQAGGPGARACLYGRRTAAGCCSRPCRHCRRDSHPWQPCHRCGRPWKGTAARPGEAWPGGPGGTRIH